jgi:thiopeptide-type bacteriocin biosynthesis protein
LERYGLSTIEESEDIFQISSEQAINIIQNNPEAERWKYCLKNIDTFLNVFKYSIQDKLNLFNHLRLSFDNEFNPDNLIHIHKQINTKYRSLKKEIDDILDLSHVDKYDQQYIEIYKKLHQKVNFNQINKLMESYIHMFCNRTFVSKQRLNEWILYNLLYKHYLSQKIQNKE